MSAKPKPLGVRPFRVKRIMLIGLFLLITLPLLYFLLISPSLAQGDGDFPPPDQGISLGETIRGELTGNQPSAVYRISVPMGQDLAISHEAEADAGLAFTTCTIIPTSEREYYPVNPCPLSIGGSEMIEYYPAFNIPGNERILEITIAYIGNEGRNISYSLSSYALSPQEYKLGENLSASLIPGERFQLFSFTSPAHEPFLVRLETDNETIAESESSFAYLVHHRFTRSFLDPSELLYNPLTIENARIYYGEIWKDVAGLYYVGEDNFRILVDLEESYRLSSQLLEMRVLEEGVEESIILDEENPYYWFRLNTESRGGTVVFNLEILEGQESRRTVGFYTSKSFGFSASQGGDDSALRTFEQRVNDEEVAYFMLRGQPSTLNLGWTFKSE